MAQILSFQKKKYHFQHILINGCSHTAGSEIEGPGIGEGNYNRDNCFGAQLARKLGVVYTNIALPGASNDYINRSTAMWMLDNPALAKHTLYLIHWTGSSRSEIFFDESKTDSYWQFLPYVSDRNVGHIHPDHYANVIPAGSRRNANTLSKSLFINEEHWEINRYLNIINLQTLLQANEFPCIFKNGFQSCANGPRYDYYQKKIVNEKFVGYNDPKMSFFEHCLARGFSIDGQEYWHHTKAAHDYWADLLYLENFS